MDVGALFVVIVVEKADRVEIIVAVAHHVAQHHLAGVSRSETFENLLITVIPANAGIQNILKSLDTGFHRYDDLPNFRSNSIIL